MGLEPPCWRSLRARFMCDPAKGPIDRLVLIDVRHQGVPTAEPLVVLDELLPLLRGLALDADADLRSRRVEPLVLEAPEDPVMHMQGVRRRSVTVRRRHKHLLRFDLLCILEDPVVLEALGHNLSKFEGLELVAGCRSRVGRLWKLRRGSHSTTMRSRHVGLLELRARLGHRGTRGASRKGPNGLSTK